MAQIGMGQGGAEENSQEVHTDCSMSLEVASPMGHKGFQVSVMHSAINALYVS